MRLGASRRLPRTILLIGIALSGLLSVPARAALVLADVLDCSSPASRARHDVRLDGGILRSETATVGRLTLPVAGAMLSPGGAFTARVGSAAATGTRGLLAITFATSPAHQGRRQSFHVYVGGSEVYRAIEPDPGAGVTRTCFVEADLRRGGVHLRVLADRETTAPITVAMVRVYREEPDNPAAPQEPSERMGLALLTSLDSGYRVDEAELRRIAAMLPRSRFVIPQAAVLYNFCMRNPTQNSADIRRLADTARLVGIPLRIAFQMHWAGLPAGVADGAGGTFTDLPYQQITYDPDEQAEKPDLAALMGPRYDAHYGLTVPNRWGNTPWLTMNHPRLNQYRRLRLKQAVGAWRTERDRLREGGLENLLPGELSTGEETVYWAKGVDDSAYTAFNGGKPRTRLMADFNPFTVAAAARDGVTLDPRKGLDATQRTWLHLNLARWQQTIVNWMRDGLPPEPVRLSADTPTYADDLVARNVYTEPYAMPVYPMKALNSLHPGLEVGYVLDGRSGGEYWSGAAMLPWLTKERERGRIALPNLECTGADDGQLVACLRAAYAFGARFATLYNWQHRGNTGDLLASFARSVGQPAGVRFDGSLSAAKAIGSAPLNRQYEALADAFGVNRVEVALRCPASARVTLRVSLRELGEPRPIAVAATGRVALPVGGAWTWVAVRLPAVFPQVPGKRYEVGAEVVDGRGVQVAAGPDGMLAARLLSDLGSERTRSIAIEDWQDASDLIESVARRHAAYKPAGPIERMLRDARRELARGSVRAAYRAAIRAEQASVPAAFEVPRPGAQLTPYDVSVECPLAPVLAVVRDYTDRLARVVVRSPRAQVVAVKRGGVRTSATIAPNVDVQLWVERTTAAPAAPAPRRHIRRTRPSTAAAGPRVTGAARPTPARAAGLGH